MTTLFNNEISVQILLLLVGAIPLLRAVINNFNITPVEKLLLTDDRKVFNSFLENFILSILTALGLTLFFGSVMVNGELGDAGTDENSTVLKELSFQYFVSLFVFILIVSFTLFSLILLFIFTYAKFIKIKINYFIVEGGKKWYLKRRTSKNRMLLRSEFNSVKFLEVSTLLEKEIFAEEYKEKQRLKFRKINPFIEYLLYFVGLGVIFFAQFIVLETDINVKQFSTYGVLMLLSAFILVTPFAIKSNERIILELSENEEDEENQETEKKES